MTLGIWYSRDVIKGLYKKEFWKDALLYTLGSLAIVAICYAGSILFTSTMAIILFDIILSIVEYVLILLGMKNKFAFNVLEHILVRFK